jgi:hypothetical protein
MEESSFFRVPAVLKACWRTQLTLGEMLGRLGAQARYRRVEAALTPQ